MVALDERLDNRDYILNEGDKMVVLFDDAGCKTLAVESVLERGLLEPEAES